MVRENGHRMSAQNDRVPKAYRLRLHRLKNAYRRAFRHEPRIERPVTEQAALEAIHLLEQELRQAGAPTEEETDARA
jgi:hypothetical protein